MPSLKSLKNRIASVKSTRKITSAMKMVAGAKLRRAEEQANAARPYAERMERMLGELSASLSGQQGAPKLMAGTGKDDVQLLVVCTADRGLCGGFNASIVKEVRRKITELESAGKTVKLYCVGRKGRDMLRRDHADKIVGTLEDVAKPALTFDKADDVARLVLGMYEQGEFDVCTVYYNLFQSAMTQIVTPQQLIPFAPPAKVEDKEEGSAGLKAMYEFEPSEEGILEALLPRNLAVQVFRAMLESAASEQGARMTAMDNATRNAGDMIDNLSLTYNRTRQAVITSELIEIISGAEAV